MPTRSSKPHDHDFATNARRIVEQTIGEHLDGTPLEDPNAGKNPAAVALGRFGRRKGWCSQSGVIICEKTNRHCPKSRKGTLA